MQASVIVLVLFLIIALCEWLVQKTFLKHFGTALLVILLTAIVANLGIIPTASNAPPLYDFIFSVVAPLAIFYLLLEVNFKVIRDAGLPILLMFFIGSAGTFIGIYSTSFFSENFELLGDSYPVLAGMFTGTYTGGSINFNAVALHYEMNKDGNLYAGAVAIDNIYTTLWMMLTILLPKLLMKRFPRAKLIRNNLPKSQVEEDTLNDIERVNPLGLSVLIFLGLTALLFSNWAENYFGQFGIPLPSIIVLTTLSLLIAQSNIAQKVRGSRVLGILGIYLFLAIIGAYCEFAAVPRMGGTAFEMLTFVGIGVLVHGVITYGAGYFLKMDWDIVSIASQANVGGSGSALALARSLDRNDLLLAAILIGTLGNAVGTYLGFLIVALLG